ncbi:hypothetical protein D3Z58_21125 [Clostridiaceae bacterium]|nr:hypothetical protein [Clostridiaceae bacterium]
MNNVFEFITNTRDYALHFQNVEYIKHDFENFYLHVDVMGKEVEFLPGIFYKLDLKHSILLKGMLAILRSYEGESKLIKILPKVLDEKFGTRIITIQFRNIRDSYSFFINQEKVYENKKNYQGKDDGNFQYKYEYVKEEPEYLEIPTERILFPCRTGGEGTRCSLKGVFREAGIFTTSTYKDHYMFFNEYEMHCLTACSEEIRDICKTCNNCMRTVELMKEGRFVGPTKGNDSDCLTVGEYDGRYVIENGNHRACCAKAFGIPLVKAKVNKYRRTDELCQEPKVNNRGDNQKVLDSFYKVFDERGISRPLVNQYLETDGTDVGLIKLLKVI